MVPFQGRVPLLMALAGFLFSQLAAADHAGQPALLPPVSLSGPLPGQPLPVLPAVSSDEQLAISLLDEPASAIEPLPQSFSPSLPPDFQTAMDSAWGSDVAMQPTATSRSICRDAPYCLHPCWFGSLGGLIMKRDHGGALVTSVDTASGAAVLGTDDVFAPGVGGLDLSLGRWFGGGAWGIGVDYWGVYPSPQTADVFGASTVGALDTTFDFTALNYDNGVTNSTVDDWFDDAVRHQVRHRNEYHSLEVNFLGGHGFVPWGNAFGPRLGCGWSLGVRYFRFEDDFAFLSDDVDSAFVGDADEVTYDVRTQNDLLGFQFGAGVSYRLWRNLSLHGMAKAGIYGVHARQEQFVGGAGGLAVINTGPFAGQAYNVSATETDVGMLAQLDLGGSWQFSPRWSVQMNYRLLGLTGVALIDDQIPADFANLSQAASVNSNGSLLLHGAYVGVTYAF